MTERMALVRARAVACVGLALVTAVSLAAASCGGSEEDDIKNIQATATAAAKNRPSPTVTPDPAGVYRQKVTAAGKRLSEATDQLHKDMLAASVSQADPKWPTVLTAGADGVIAAAAAVQALVPPDEKYRAFATGLNEVTATLDKGAKMLKQAIPTGDQEIGAQAFFAIDEGKTKLPGVLGALPPE